MTVICDWKDAMADDSGWPGPYYRKCESADTCPVAYAYWSFDPPVEHYHFIGSPTVPR